MRPVIMDSTEFFDEILERVRGWATVTTAGAALRGDIRIFAGPHVAAEVPGKIRANFPRRGASVSKALRLWKEEYLPLVYFVDTNDINIESPQLAELATRDATDVAQARLVALLAPVISLSSDKDLTDHGFARPERWSVAWASEARAQAQGSYLLVALPGQVAWTAIRSFDVAATTRWGPLGRFVSVGAFDLAVWIVVHRYRNASPRTRAAIVQVVERLVQTVVQANERHITATERLDRTHVVPEGLEDALITDLARVLTTATDPMTTTELARNLWDDVTPVNREFFQIIRQELEVLPAFIKVDRHRWQLGATINQHQSGAGRAFVGGESDDRY